MNSKAKKNILHDVEATDNQYGQITPNHEAKQQPKPNKAPKKLWKTKGIVEYLTRKNKLTTERKS